MSMLVRKKHLRLIFWALILLFLSAGSIFFLRWSRNVNIGSSDFNAYWAASRLFLEGRNPCDPKSMLEIERAHMSPDQEYVMMTWNPPTLWVLLLPLALMPFQTARVVWLLINLLIVPISCFLLWRIFFPSKRIGILAIYCLIAIFFSPILVSILTGQITLLVLLGLSSCLFLIKREKWFWAGIALILISVKPHLVILTGPYLILYMVVRRKWSGLLGISTAVAICLAFLFVLRPSWIVDYITPLSSPPTFWETPTFGGVLKSYGAGSWSQYIGFGFLGLLPFLLRKLSPLTLESTTSLLTLVTVPITFFGWSYDQNILLLPIAEIICWTAAPSSSRRARWVVALLVVCVLVVSMIQRVKAMNEVVFFWVPLAWWAIYALAAWMTGRGHPSKLDTS